MSTDYDKEKWGALDIKHLIIDTKDYIVFIDNDLDLDWITTTDYDSRGHKTPDLHSDILNRIALLECRPNGHFDQKITVDYKRLLGEALARSFSGEYDSANKIISESELYVDQRGMELSRRWYLSAAGLLCLILALIAFMVWPFRDWFIHIWGERFFTYATAMVFGSLGALLSIILRTGSEQFDCHAGRALHQIESSYRVVAGMLSALLAVLAVKSEFILPFLNGDSDQNTVLYFVAFVSGMSERIAPSITTKIEESTEKRM